MYVRICRVYEGNLEQRIVLNKNRNKLVETKRARRNHNEKYLNKFLYPAFYIQKYDL